jgi:short subunit dehydrogenase-like uncharacterized protein
MAKQYGPSGTRVKWAIAGRNVDKLNSIASDLGEGVLDPSKHVIIADAADAAALRALVQRTDVVVACAGPFSRYGSILVAECVRAGSCWDFPSAGSAS